MQPVHFGKFTVGNGYPPLILPDIDMFFNGDLGLAESLIAGVRQAGLGLIKAAIITDAGIAFDKGGDEVYLDNNGQTVRVDYRRLLEKKVMTPDEHRRLFDYTRRQGLQMIVSVYDLDGVGMAVEEGCVGIKIASSNITHKPLLQAAAASGLPLLVDTGKSTFDEIMRALGWIRECASECPVVIEHSPYAPPAPIEQQNLMAIPFLREALEVNVGLSHHARGPLMMFASVALAPAVIEFGLCGDNPESDQDVYHAVSVGQLPSLVEDVSQIYRALGDRNTFLTREHPVNRGRMSLRAARELQPGEAISLDNTAFSFPILGVPVEQWDQAVGRAVRHRIVAGDPIGFDDLV